ncbi:MAG TPA: sigma-70 family RNA polymerase sigma factor [Planctomycetota bacterium]
MSDPAAIAQLVLKHRHGLLAYLYAAVPDAHAVEDLFQEICLVAVRKAADFEDGSDFAAWARAIARHKVHEHLRVRRGVHVDEAFFDSLDAAFPAAVDDRRKDVLRRCLEKLQSHARQLLSWRYDDGLSPTEIARRTGQSRAAVNSILQRVRETLRACAGAP